MIKLEMLQNQILDTKKLISDTKRLKMLDSNNSVLDFIIKQDEVLLDNLQTEEKKILLSVLNEKLPVNFDIAEQLVFYIYGTNYIGQIEPIKIAEKLNIKVVADYNMIDGIGRSEFNGNETVITYKPTNKYRDKFTIAHELGHIFLHFKKGIEFCFVDKEIEDKTTQILEAARLSSSNNSKLEEEANKFAGELLIPKFILEKLIEKIPRGKALKASLIKDYFAVSNDVTRIALNDYGMFNNGTFVNNLEQRRW
jgi:Zn-dependent peptidase ImmA (M78 family)